MNEGSRWKFVRLARGHMPLIGDAHVYLCKQRGSQIMQCVSVLINVKNRTSRELAVSESLLAVPLVVSASSLCA